MYWLVLSELLLDIICKYWYDYYKVRLDILEKILFLDIIGNVFKFSKIKMGLLLILVICLKFVVRLIMKYIKGYLDRFLGILF